MNSHKPAIKVDSELEKQLRRYEFSFVIASSREKDMPIVYASDGFYALTGYSPEEVLGKNCRFLQGPETCRQKIMEIRDAVREDRATEVCLLNYKKNGEKFWNQFFLAPCFDDNGQVEYYLGIQTNVTDELPQEGPETAGWVAEYGCSEVACQQFENAGEVEKLLHRFHVLKPGAHLLRTNDPESPGPVKSPKLPTSLLHPLMKLQQAFVLSDPTLPDAPIVYASESFLHMTGYPRDQVLGRNCRFLQGEGTDPAEVKRLHDAMSSVPPKPVTVTLLNYRYDGTPFYNSLHVAPVRNAAGEVTFFVGVQLDVTAAPPQEEESLGNGAVANGVASAAAAAAAALGCPAPSGRRPSFAGEPGLREKRAQKSVVGAVRVACRSLSGVGSSDLRRSLEDQIQPRSPRKSDASGDGGGSSRSGSRSSSWRNRSPFGLPIPDSDPTAPDCPPSHGPPGECQCHESPAPAELAAAIAAATL